MRSTFKFPLALAVLHQAELGKLQLDQPVRFLKSDRYKTFSLLQDEFPKAVAIFVTDAHANRATCEAMIARIAKAIYGEAVAKHAESRNRTMRSVVLLPSSRWTRWLPCESRASLI